MHDLFKLKFRQYLKQMLSECKHIKRIDSFLLFNELGLIFDVFEQEIFSQFVELFYWNQCKIKNSNEIFKFVFPDSHSQINIPDSHFQIHIYNTIKFDVFLISRPRQGKFIFALLSDGNARNISIPPEITSGIILRLTSFCSLCWHFCDRIYFNSLQVLSGRKVMQIGTNTTRIILKLSI